MGMGLGMGMSMGTSFPRLALAGRPSCTPQVQALGSDQSLHVEESPDAVRQDVLQVSEYVADGSLPNTPRRRSTRRRLCSALNGNSTP
jgi:hypothetical protein